MCKTHSLSSLVRLLYCPWSTLQINAHLGHWRESIVCEHKDTSVIRLEIIDLLLKQ